MKKKVLIIGAGSIGNHMANACLKNKFDVFVTDISPKALFRMKNKVFSQRYGKWDNRINLINYKNIFNFKKNDFELLIIGTPPNTHIKLFKIFKEKYNFKKILIEKPLCSNTEKNIEKVFKKEKKIKVFIGYNHSVSDSFKYFLLKLKKIKPKNINFISVKWCEGWRGILNAHFWLKNEFDTYLGDLKKGGGALHEHSHGLHILLVLLNNIKKKLPQKHKKIISYNKNKKRIYYDNYSHASWKIDNLLISYQTDLLSDPAEKSVKIFTKNEVLLWYNNYVPNKDLVSIRNIKYNKQKEIFFKKSRSSDFINEIKYILNTKNYYEYKNSPININYGLNVQKLIRNTLR